MALQDYGRMGTFVNGSFVREVTSIHLTTNAGNQRVDVLNEGLSGFTPGSGDVQIELGFVVPAGGTEEEYQEMCANRDFVTMQIPIGAKAYIGNGKIETVSISQSNGASVEGTLTWLGELSALQ